MWRVMAELSEKAVNFSQNNVNSMSPTRAASEGKKLDVKGIIQKKKSRFFEEKGLFYLQK